MNMRKYIFATAASLLMTTSLNAGDYSVKNSDGQYLELYSGATSIEDVRFNASAELLPGLTLDAKGQYGFDVGWTAGGRVGGPLFSKEKFPLLGKFRGEIDGSYSEIDYDDFDATLTASFGGNSISTGGSTPIDGNLEVVDLYMNMYYDAEVITNHFAPFWGIGIGMTHSKEEIKTVGYAGDQLTVNSEDKYTNGGIQIILGANLVNFGDVSAGIRFIRREIWNGDEYQDSTEVLGTQVHFKYNF